MNELITQNQLCSEIGVSRKTIYKWRLQGLPMVWANNGKEMYLYELSAVKRWMKQNDKF